ncbi:hypothetical protein A3728_19145 [Sulfitobacter sp. HI0040]|uniref:hypothetical protein n=1 Tax=Sulfitobacter sp. HI0040 TaxID=1822232 RepID=UPI0007C3939D|nr:hypothetical protein [Sulfitobacter sp. HI0040]KZY25358.1 hypothetical protein A3728_19145 [Sulfitobacter sp. HI0040]KZZ68066.1 hypothetical protein A3764_13785 [Sulfitobacter sp. HI0129]
MQTVAPQTLFLLEGQGFHVVAVNVAGEAGQRRRGSGDKALCVQRCHDHIVVALHRVRVLGDAGCVELEHM